MSGRNQIGILISAIGGILAVTIYDAARGAHIGPLLAAFIGIGANILFVTFSVQWLTDSAMRYGPYRRMFDSRAQFEGYWLAKVSNLADRPYEISVISYNPDSAGYVYFGRSLSENFEVTADWGTTQLEVDVNESRIRFVYEGAVSGGSNSLQGFGYINFDRAPSGEFMTARGFFVDIDQTAGPHHHHFTMQRITETDILNSISGSSRGAGRRAKVHLTTNDEYSKVAKHMLAP